VKSPNSLRCIKILSSCHSFFFFLPSPFYNVKTHLWMIMMESKIYFGLKYNHFENFDNFWLIIFYGDRNKRVKKIAIRTRPLLFCVVHLKGFFTLNKDAFCCSGTTFLAFLVWIWIFNYFFQKRMNSLIFWLKFIDQKP
jgi:hypothetical protein